LLKHYLMVGACYEQIVAAHDSLWINGRLWSMTPSA
jgi:hypothetical protein